MKGTSFTFWVDTPEAHLAIRNALVAAGDAADKDLPGIVIAQVEAPGSVRVKGAFVPQPWAKRIQDIIIEYGAHIRDAPTGDERQ